MIYLYSVKNVFLLVVLVATAIAPVCAAPEDQKIVKDYNASPGWTSIVPINVDSSDGNDFISDNAETGHTIVSAGIGTSGDQKIVKDYNASPGWTSIVPMKFSSSDGTDLLSYNAETGHTIVSAGECIFGPR